MAKKKNKETPEVITEEVITTEETTEEVVELETEVLEEVENGKPSCFGKFVKTGSPECRKCWSAQECKKL